MLQFCGSWIVPGTWFSEVKKNYIRQRTLHYLCFLFSFRGKDKDYLQITSHSLLIIWLVTLVGAVSSQHQSKAFGCFLIYLLASILITLYYSVISYILISYLVNQFVSPQIIAAVLFLGPPFYSFPLFSFSLSWGMGPWIPLPCQSWNQA